MDLRFLCLLIIMKYAGGHKVPPSASVHHQAFYYHPLQSYPAYQIISAQSKSNRQEENSTTKSSTVSPPNSEHEARTKNSANVAEITPTDSSIDSIQKAASESGLATLEVSTDNTIYTPAEFPHDLLEIARTKLGLKSLDEVPSISELAEYLGTANAEETIKYIRHLTSTEQGVTLVKAYLESADFTDRTEDKRRRQQHRKEASVEGETLTKSKKSLLERIAAYFHIYNIWPQTTSDTASANATRKAMEQQLSKYIKPQMEYRKRKQQYASAQLSPHHQQPQHQATGHHIPLLYRNPLPYHYPIPLRPIHDNRALPSQPAIYSSVHLNTPKFYVPPHIQLARAANIPPQQLQALLQSKPKLAELAAKVNHLPLSNDQSGGQIHAQLLAAVRRAVEQDEDLRKLLQATAETLK